MPLVFVYGTLKQGFGLHRILENDKFLGEAYTINEAFDLFSSGGFPYLWKGSHRVRGELYEVSDETMKHLDYVEGVPRHYNHIYPIVAYEDEGAKAEVKACAFMAAANYNFNDSMRVGIKLEKATNAKYWEK